MPIYEYQCLKCGEVFEVFQKLSDPPPKSHSCGGKRIKRVMSRTSFVLKGTGWYITDYGRKDKGTGENGSSSGSSHKSAAKTPESDKGGAKSKEAGSGETSAKSKERAGSGEASTKGKSAAPSGTT